MHAESSELCRQHAQFAHEIAYRVHRQYRVACRPCDLTGYAFTGLLEAARSFDAARGVPFRTFAYTRVRGAVLDGARGMMPLGCGQHRRLEAARRTVHETSDAAAIEAAHRTIAELSLRSVATALGYEPITFAIPARAEIDPLDEDPPGTFAVIDATSPEDALERAQRWARLEPAIASLTAEEQVVVRGTYFEDRNLESIGGELGLSKSWACRIHQRAIRRLQRALADAR